MVPWHSGTMGTGTNYCPCCGSVVFTVTTYTNTNWQPPSYYQSDRARIVRELQRRPSTPLVRAALRARPWPPVELRAGDLQDGPRPSTPARRTKPWHASIRAYAGRVAPPMRRPAVDVS